ncbi:hypothetical protein IG631_15392 [Alternaria alternata]|nr:hypothetical protein IG631_15392 [Alternaria alternata]
MVAPGCFSAEKEPAIRRPEFAVTRAHHSCQQLTTCNTAHSYAHRIHRRIHLVSVRHRKYRIHSMRRLCRDGQAKGSRAHGMWP